MSNKPELIAEWGEPGKERQIWLSPGGKIAVSRWILLVGLVLVVLGIASQQLWLPTLVGFLTR